MMTIFDRFVSLPFAEVASAAIILCMLRIVVQEQPKGALEILQSIIYLSSDVYLLAIGLFFASKYYLAGTVRIGVASFTVYLIFYIFTLLSIRWARRRFFEEDYRGAIIITILSLTVSIIFLAHTISVFA
ncbi:hypothetical protein KQI63_14140 [bacterium]|nr:hypothetical protein [bacterium]